MKKESGITGIVEFAVAILIMMFIFRLMFNNGLIIRFLYDDQITSEVQLEKCTDGDTAHFMIAGEDVTVRFLAIDTPETKHPAKGEEPFGREASEYTCSALQKATVIELEYDEGSDREEKYGRQLAWVFIDGDLLQEHLVELGYAKVAYLYGDYKYTDQLLEAEKRAKASHLGIWNEGS